jgi:ferrous iron transport protein A
MGTEQPSEPGLPAGHPGPLSEVAVGTRVRIETLPSHSGLKDRLLALGIRPGVEGEVLRRGRPGGILHLAHGLLEFMLRQEHARQMTVTPCPGNLSPQGRP